MKQFTTIQHTQSEHHVNGMVGSWTDWPLTETGRIQAERAAGAQPGPGGGQERAVAAGESRNAGADSG